MGSYRETSSNGIGVGARGAAPRRLAYLLISAALTLILGVSLASATLAANGSPFPSQSHGIAVTGSSPAVVAGLMPGGTAVIQVVELQATGAMRYQLSVAYSGSEALAKALVVTLTGSDGSVLYQGPLADARVGGSSTPSVDDPALADGQTEVISVSAALPLEATAELSGQSLELRTVVSSYQDAR